MATIVRKKQDSEGIKKFLGVPYKNVFNSFDSEITSEGLTIQDAFSIQEINIDDDHSTGVLSLLSDIVTVKRQERLQVTDFTAPQMEALQVAYDAITDSNFKANYSSTPGQYFMEEVDVEQQKNLPPILHAYTWPYTNKVSYLSCTNSAKMDGLTDMSEYGIHGSTDTVITDIPIACLGREEDGKFILSDFALTLLNATKKNGKIVTWQDNMPQPQEEILQLSQELVDGEDPVFTLEEDSYNFGWIVYKDLQGNLHQLKDIYKDPLRNNSIPVYSFNLVLSSNNLDAGCIVYPSFVGINGMLPSWVTAAKNLHPELSTQSIIRAYTSYNALQNTWLNPNAESKLGFQVNKFIQTKISASVRDTIKMKMMFSQTSSDYNTIIQINGTNTRLFPYSNNYYFDSSPSSGYSRLTGGRISPKTWYHIELCNNTSKYIKDLDSDTILTSTSAYTSDVTQECFYKFGCQGAGNGSTYNIIQYIEIYSQDGGLKAFLVPYIKNNQMGMYDAVGDEFYTDASATTDIQEY